MLHADTNETTLASTGEQNGKTRTADPLPLILAVVVLAQQ